MSTRSDERSSPARVTVSSPFWTISCTDVGYESLSPPRLRLQRGRLSARTGGDVHAPTERAVLRVRDEAGHVVGAWTIHSAAVTTIGDALTDHDGDTVFAALELRGERMESLDS